MVTATNYLVNHNPNQNPNAVEIEGEGFGHRFKIFREKAHHAIMDAFRAIGEAFNQRSPLGKIFKFSINILTGVAHSVGHAFHGAGLLKALNIVDGFSDCLDIFSDANHLVNQKYRKKLKDEKGNALKDKYGDVRRGPIKNKIALTATIAFFVADVAGLVLWLNDLALINLGKLSASIGKGFAKLGAALGPKFAQFSQTFIKTFPFVAKVAAKVTLVNVLRGVVAGAFLALAINESRNLVNAIKERNVQKIVNSSLYLASYVTEIALKVLVIVGFTNVYGLVVLGCLAAGLGLAAFFMEVVRKYREERALHQDNKPPAEPPVVVQEAIKPSIDKPSEPPEVKPNIDKPSELSEVKPKPPEPPVAIAIAINKDGVQEAVQEQKALKAA